MVGYTLVNMKLVALKMPADLIDLIKGTAAIVDSPNVSEFIRRTLQERCLEIRWDSRRHRGKAKKQQVAVYKKRRGLLENQREHLKKVQ